MLPVWEEVIFLCKRFSTILPLTIWRDEWADFLHACVVSIKHAYCSAFSVLYAPTEHLPKEQRDYISLEQPRCLCIGIDRTVGPITNHYWKHGCILVKWNTAWKTPRWNVKLKSSANWVCLQRVSKLRRRTSRFMKNRHTLLKHQNTCHFFYWSASFICIFPHVQFVKMSNFAIFI